jgi:hypothetical protein
VLLDPRVKLGSEVIRRLIGFHVDDPINVLKHIADLIVKGVLL